MTEWRFLRSWTEAELAQRLARLSGRRNFEELDHEMTVERQWGRHFSEAVIAREAPGPPMSGGPFERAWPLLQEYAFSDPRIVRGYFDRSAPLLGRRMLLEARVLGLRYLGPVMIASTREDSTATTTTKGFRYDTLEGHFERGCEWFIITKQHATGDVLFRIHAAWKRGQLPNWWSRVGFLLLARRYQRAWHRLAHLRMRSLLGATGLGPLPRGRRLVTEGPDFPVVPVTVQAAASGAPPPAIRIEHDTAAPPATTRPSTTRPSKTQLTEAS